MKTNDAAFSKSWLRRILTVLAVIGIAACAAVLLPQVREAIIGFVERVILRRELRDPGKWNRGLLVSGIAGIIVLGAVQFLIHFHCRSLLEEAARRIETHTPLRALISKKFFWSGWVFAVVFLRGLPRIIHAEIWAEDGAIFLSQAWNEGLASLGNVYAGYFHLIPRLAAIALTFLPVVVIPWVIVLLCSFGTALICCSLLREEYACLFPSLALRGVISVLFALAPAGTEIYGNLCNLQWYLLLYLTLLMCADIDYHFKPVQIGVIALGSASMGALPVVMFLFTARVIRHIFRKDTSHIKEDVLLGIIFSAAFAFFVYGILHSGRISSSSALFSLKYVLNSLFLAGGGILGFPLLLLCLLLVFPVRCISGIKTGKLLVFALLALSALAYAFITVAGCNLAQASVLQVSSLLRPYRYSSYFYFISLLVCGCFLQYIIAAGRNRIVFSSCLIGAAVLLAVIFPCGSYGKERLWLRHYKELEDYLSSRDTQTKELSVPIYPIWDLPRWFIVLRPSKGQYEADRGKGK